jgi:hypothetical protein
MLFIDRRIRRESIQITSRDSDIFIQRTPATVDIIRLLGF